MIDASRVAVVIPAFNEEQAIGAVVEGVIAGLRPLEVLVVDDGSGDQTVARATAAGARVLRHPYNKGNGAAVKTGVREARGEVVLLMDADGQHDPKDAGRLIEALVDHDMVIGSRASRDQTFVRALGNVVFRALASWLTGRPIPDLTSGFRAARRSCLREFLHLLPNGFSTPTTTTLAFIKAGYNVGFEPVDAATRVGSSKIRLARDGAKFFLIILRIVTIFSPLRVFLPVSLASFAVGVGYAVWTVITQAHITNSSVLLIMLAVVVFLVGLVSEQIAALRFEGRE